MKKSDLQQIRQSIVFIGSFTMNEKGTKDPFLLGTGVLLNIEGCFHLATAKHVILDPTSKDLKYRDNLYFFVNGKPQNDPVYAIPFDFILKKGWGWIYHDDPVVDVAITPFLLDLEHNAVKTIPQKLFLSLENVYETNDVFYLSFQPNVSNIELDKSVIPIVRKGSISRINPDRTYFIDGFAFPGNSGSPVFMLPSATRITEQGISLGGDQLGGKFIGIIGEYIPYQDIAFSKQTGRPRVVFEENTGLSRVWSVDFLEEIIKTDKFQKSLALVKGELSTENKNAKEKNL